MIRSRQTAPISLQLGQFVKDEVGDLGVGEVIDRYRNVFCGPSPVDMITVRFGSGHYADRRAHEVSIVSEH